MTKESIKTLHDLRAELSENSLTEIRAVSDSDRVLAALDWLISVRRADGTWGEQQEGTTSLAVLALKAWADTELWTTSHPVDWQATEQWLSEPFLEGRSWRTPWYSAVAIQALTSLGAPRSTVQAGLECFDALDPTDSHYWFDHVHHAAQILSAFGESGAPQHRKDPWVTCIREHLSERCDPYVRGQAVYALIRWSGVRLDELVGEVRVLRKYLTRITLSKSSAFDYFPALQAVSYASGASTGSGDELSSSKTSELLGRMEGGSWYRDPEMTAWALLSLYRVSTVSQVVIPELGFNDAFSRSLVSIPRQEIRRRRETAVLSAVTSLGVAVIAGILVAAGNSDSLLVSGIIIGVGAPLLITAALRLYKLLRYSV